MPLKNQNYVTFTFLTDAIIYIIYMSIGKTYPISRNFDKDLILAS